MDVSLCAFSNTESVTCCWSSNNQYYKQSSVARSENITFQNEHYVLDILKYHSVSGNVIPKDIDIAIFTYGILRSPEYFPNPEVFNPDRWENIDGSKPYAYIPFSAGPRNCIGKSHVSILLGYSITL